MIVWLCDAIPAATADEATYAAEAEEAEEAKDRGLGRGFERQQGREDIEPRLLLRR